VTARDDWSAVLPADARVVLDHLGHRIESLQGMLAMTPNTTEEHSGIRSEYESEIRAFKKALRLLEISR